MGRTIRETRSMIATAPGQAMNPVSPARPETIDIIRVEIGGIGFALPLSSIATILAPSAMAKRNDDTNWVGFVPSRGGDIPVANGRTVFGLGNANTSDRRLLILRGTPATGLLVDAIHGTNTITTGDIEWLSPLFGPVERLLTQAVIWNTDGALDLIIDIPALRRHLHVGVDTSSSTSGSVATLFDHAPPGDRLEVRLDNSDRSWLLSIAYVRHISGPRPPARLPLANSAILGLLAWRREPIPLIDTARLLDLPPTTPTTLIVVGPASQPDGALLALTVTDITGVATPYSDAETIDLVGIVRRLG